MKFITENTFLNLKVKKILLKTTPVLVNSYNRRYFVSACRKFRITFESVNSVAKILRIYEIKINLNNKDNNKEQL